MEIVVVKTKFQIVIPQNVRQQIDLAVGDILEASVEGGKITFTPKTIVDRHLAEGLEDLRKGRTHGPYATVDAAITALDKRAKSRSKKPKKT